MLVALVGGSLVLSTVLSRNTEAAARLSEYRRVVTDVIGAARDAEIGQRGYLLTGDPQYLEPYHAAVKAIDPALARVAAQGPRGAAVARVLEPTVRAKLDEMTRTLVLSKRGQRDAAMALVRTDVGKTLMDRMRVIFEGERQWAIAQSNALSAGSAQAVRFLIIGLIAGMVAIMFLSLAWYRRARRQFDAISRARSEAELVLAGLLEETSAREASEAQVRQLQKMEAIGQLTGGIAHDFNNMLAIVTSGIELAKRRLRHDADETEMFLEASLDGAHRAAALTNRLLAFSRNQPLAPQPLDLNALLNGMTDMLARALGESIAFETRCVTPLWRCYADGGEVENALLNLVVNARDAMPDGGTLTIATRNNTVTESDAAHDAAIEPGEYVEICVADTGTGMAPDVIARAFDPFFTTKDVGKGTGLGLSQVFGFAKQSGGFVTITSEVGSGTAVRLHLPRFFGSELPTGPQQHRGEDIPTGSKSEVILVVEDELRVRQFAVDVLHELGYSALSAASPSEALSIIEDRRDIAMLFTDVVMPEMNGRELADRGRAVRPDLRILYTSGYTQKAVVHDGVIDVGVALLSKPYTIRDMARKVRDVLDGGGANRTV